MASKDVLSARAGADRHEKVEEWMDEYGRDDKSEALKEMIDVAHREAHSPVVARVRERAVDTAWYLSLVAAVTIIAGWSTTVMTPTHGVRVGVMIAVLGYFPLATVELFKIVRGESVLTGGDPA